MQKKTIFYKKNFLIYGFGKSGYASYKFLCKTNNCKIIDDNKKNIPSKYIHKTIKYKQLKNNNFDYIVLSPGIDLNKCRLSRYLKKNSSKVIKGPGMIINKKILKRSLNLKFFWYLSVPADTFIKIYQLCLATEVKFIKKKFLIF